MKKIFKTILLIAAPAMAVLSCAKENVEPVQKGETVHFSTAELFTKSHFGDKVGDSYPILWTEGQQVGIVYGGSASPSVSRADVNPSEDLKTASFSKSFEASTTAEHHNFYIASPADAAIGYSNGSYNLSIPSSQIPADGTCDEKAQITVARHISPTFDVEINDLQFSHVTAYGRLSVTLSEGAGEVSSIALNASKNISGRYYHSFETGELSENTASATITLNTSKTQDIFFGCAPVDLTDELLEVVVTAANGTYEKMIDFSSVANPLKFEAGKVSKFSVADFTKKESDEVYTLVTDASTLKIGDKVIIAAAGYEYAISTTQNTNNRAQASITKKGSTIVNPGNDVQLFTLEQGSESGTYAFNTGSGYIYAASNSKNYLKTQTSIDANASWTVTCLTTKDNVVTATIKAQGANSRNTIKYNSDNNSGLIFSCYSQGQKDVAIYTDGKGTGSLPTPPPSNTIFEESFSSDQGQFTIDDVTLPADGKYVWKFASGNYGMKASSYINNTNLASESYLISPEIDLSDETSAVLTFSHALNFLNGNNASDFVNLVARKTGDESWQNLTIPKFPSGDGWDFVVSGEIDLKDYLGSKMQFAFRYVSTTSCAPTWEIKNVSVVRK